MELKALMPQKMKQAKRDRSSIPSLQNLDVVETVGSQSTMSNPTHNIIISDKAYMDYMSGENSLLPKTVKDYVIYDDKVYYIHHIYDRFAASKDVSIFNLQTKQIGIGYIENKSGCYRFTAFTKEYIEKGKCYYNHRFIWEAINKQSLSKNVIIRHIDGNKLNNSIDNLELGKRKMNEKCIQARYDAMMKKNRKW